MVVPRAGGRFGTRRPPAAGWATGSGRCGRGQEPVEESPEPCSEPGCSPDAVEPVEPLEPLGPIEPPGPPAPPGLPAPPGWPCGGGGVPGPVADGPPGVAPEPVDGGGVPGALCDPPGMPG